jgi:NADH dehydrogenase [ubiquinone] 1 alpha subcomplex assembly factor 5
MIDSSSRMLKQIRSPIEDGIEISKQHLDEEQFTGDESSYDLAYSCLTLHWINDLPGVFRKVLHVLKNDAPFIGKYV